MLKFNFHFTTHNSRITKLSIFQSRVLFSTLYYKFRVFSIPPKQNPKTRPHSFPRPLSAGGKFAEVLPNPYPQKIVLAKPSPHLNSASFSLGETRPRSPPPYKIKKRKPPPNQNRMRGGEARAERRSGNGAEHLAVFGGVDATA